MGEHFLSQYVEGEKGFRAEPWYNATGDCIEYHTINEAVVADRIDEKLTILRSVISNEPIGFKLKDIKAILSKYYGCAGMLVESVEHDKTLISLSAIILAAYEEGPSNIKRRFAYSSILLPQTPQEDLNRFNIPISQFCRDVIGQAP
jgi:hypothetical protein